jgi:hypothetical protein
MDEKQTISIDKEQEVKLSHKEQLILKLNKIEDSELLDYSITFTEKEKGIMFTSLSSPVFAGLSFLEKSGVFTDFEKGMLKALMEDGFNRYNESLSSDVVQDAEVVQ